MSTNYITMQFPYGVSEEGLKLLVFDTGPAPTESDINLDNRTNADDKKNPRPNSQSNELIKLHEQVLSLKYEYPQVTTTSTTNVGGTSSLAIFVVLFPWALIELSTNIPQESVFVPVGLECRRMRRSLVWTVRTPPRPTGDRHSPFRPVA